MKRAGELLPRRAGQASLRSPQGMGRIDLARLLWLRPVLESRWPLFLARSITLAGFLFTILAGLLGSQVGSHNFAIIFVWIAWWTALKLIFIPLGGRSWCSVCPLPMPGEWLQQGGLITKSNKPLGLGKRWPKALRGYWLQSSLFLGIGLFSAVTLTDPRVTAWVLLGLIFLSVGLSLVFEKRSFCSYVCPIGGFTGIYAQTAPVEVRVVNSAVCASHSEKTCYRECPWGLYPLALRDSSQCGLCMECLRVCPKDNIALNLRPFGTDLGSRRRSSRLDEAYMALVMLGSALAFAAVFTGTWGEIKSAAFAIGSLPWLVYAGAFLLLNLVLLPAAFALAVWLSEKQQARPTSMRRAISDRAQILLPLGLFSWIAFTISFALPKLAFVVAALSDPLGWGWNLMGSPQAIVNADKLGIAPLLQVLMLLVGLFWSINLAARLNGAEGGSASAWKRTVPLAAFSLIYSLLMLSLLVG